VPERHGRRRAGRHPCVPGQARAPLDGEVSVVLVCTAEPSGALR
jgi:ureidoglycolate hydrolase